VSQTAGKRRVTISISGEVSDKLLKIGGQYGLKLSHMIERAGRYYLAEFEDLEEALYRREHEKERMSLEDAKRYAGLED